MKSIKELEQSAKNAQRYQVKSVDDFNFVIKYKEMMDFWQEFQSDEKLRFHCFTDVYGNEYDVNINNIICFILIEEDE